MYAPLEVPQQQKNKSFLFTQLYFSPLFNRAFQEVTQLTTSTITRLKPTIDHRSRRKGTSRYQAVAQVCIAIMKTWEIEWEWDKGARGQTIPVVILITLRLRWWRWWWRRRAASPGVFTVIRVEVTTKFYAPAARAAGILHGAMCALNLCWKHIPTNIVSRNCCKSVVSACLVKRSFGGKSGYIHLYLSFQMFVLMVGCSYQAKRVSVQSRSYKQSILTRRDAAEHDLPRLPTLDADQ